MQYSVTKVSVSAYGEKVTCIFGLDPLGISGFGSVSKKIHGWILIHIILQYVNPAAPDVPSGSIKMYRISAVHVYRKVHELW